MKQLMMYLTMDKELPEITLPQGYSLSKYKGEEDIQPWINCCLDGRLIDETNCEISFQNAIGNHPYVVPGEDVFFLDQHGEHIGTATGYIKMIDNQKVGDLHMVGIRKDYRGKGLSKYIVVPALQHLYDQDVSYIVLSTDDFRISAVKLYVKLGFCPVNNDVDMLERWKKVLKEAGIKSIEMLSVDRKISQLISGD